MSTKPDNTSSVFGDYDDHLIGDHEYDGIQEYDNPMPAWWTWLFVGTVVWSVVYFAGINLGYINTYEDDLRAGQAEIEARRHAAADKKPEVSREAIIAATDDPAVLETGKQAYDQNCAACHGQKGEGQIGPNLTDKYWLHGGAPMDVYKTIDEGVTAKGMPEWGGVLGAKELLAVTAYVESLRGTDPPGAKKAEGEPYEPGG